MISMHSFFTWILSKLERRTHKKCKHLGGKKFGLDGKVFSLVVFNLRTLIVLFGSCRSSSESADKLRLMRKIDIFGAAAAMGTAEGG